MEISFVYLKPLGFIFYDQFWIFLRKSKTKNIHFLFIHFTQMFHFYTPWKRQKTFGFLTFLGGIKMKHLGKMG